MRRRRWPMVLPALVGMALLGSIQSYQDRVLACKPRRTALTVLCPTRRFANPAQTPLCERGTQPVPPRPTALAMRDPRPERHSIDDVDLGTHTAAQPPSGLDAAATSLHDVEYDADPLRPVAIIEPEDSDGMIVIRPAPMTPEEAPATSHPKTSGPPAASWQPGPASSPTGQNHPPASPPEDKDREDGPVAPPSDAIAAAPLHWPLPAASEAVARIDRKLKEQLRQAALAHRRAARNKPRPPVRNADGRAGPSPTGRRDAKPAQVTRVARPAAKPTPTPRDARPDDGKPPASPPRRPRSDRTPRPPAAERADRADRNLMLILALQDEETHVRKWAAELLGPSRDRRATQPLLRLLDDGDWNVRRAAMYALMQIRDPRAVGPLVEHLTSGSRKDKIVAALVLGRLGSRDATDALVAQLTASNASAVKISCAAALGELGDPSAVGALRGVAKDAEKAVSLACRRAVERLR